MNSIKFVISLTPISKKNSQQILVNRKTGKPFIAPSAKYKQYLKDCAQYMPKVNIDEPVNVRCLFYMPTRRKCDLTNMLESVDDVMVYYGVLEDDNSNIVVGHDGSRVLYDKFNPRTEVYIENF